MVMARYIIWGALALLGLFCALWGAFGWWFGCGKGGAMVCLCSGGQPETAQIIRYSWLRGMGLVRCPLLLVDSDLSQKEQQLLCKRYPGIEFCGLAELPARLELERKRLG